MNEKIELQLPRGDDDVQLKAYLAEHLSALHGAMDLDVADYDELAQIDRIVLHAIHIANDQIAIEYVLAFSAFHACRDLHYAHAVTRRITGLRDGCRLSFDAYIPPPARDTSDEF